MRWNNFLQPEKRFNGLLPLALLLTLLLSFTSCLNEVTEEPTGGDEPVQCELTNGEVIAEGVSVDAGDGCNTCTCTPDGLACTEIACENTCIYDTDCEEGEFCDYMDYAQSESIDSETGRMIPVVEGICRPVLHGGGCTDEAGIRHTLGDSWTEDCTTFTCTEEGITESIDASCMQGCMYNDIYIPMNSTVDVDNCNTCTCTPEGLACTEAYCPDYCSSDADCSSDEFCQMWIYKDGEKIPAPMGECLPREQVPFCEDDLGNIYEMGAAMPSDDRCSTCECGDNGERICTAIERCGEENLCFADSECDDNQHCTFVMPDCPEGMDCMPGPGECVDNYTSCFSDSECGDGQHCEFTYGTVEDGSSIMLPGPGMCRDNIQGECQTDSDCGNGACIVLAMDCKEGEKCGPNSYMSYCAYSECESDSDCGNNGECITLPSESWCKEGEKCGVPINQCVYPFSEGSATN
jgi:hypothetical protein